ncbi:hypothetical protein GBA52_024817 [Prunus armeniaca]|nr:hypothetical protein GBA52_024817 [Prunus armeniaca]
MPSSKGKKHSKNQSRAFHSNVASSFSPGSVVALTNDAGNYFALAMIFPSSKITKNGVLLSSNLSNTMGCPPSGRVIFITMYKINPKLVLPLVIVNPDVISVDSSFKVSNKHGTCFPWSLKLRLFIHCEVSGFSHGGEGFSGRWRKWISGCLESTNFSILIKGRPRGKFKASRGVRLGYPLSPFLFNLVVDVLSRLLEKAQENNMIEGIKIRNEGVEISHRQFGDDTIFFLDAAEENWEHLLELLNLFCKISGLSINKAKCSLLGINSNCEKISRLTQSWVYVFGGTREPLNSGMLLWKRWNFASKTGKIPTYLEGSMKELFARLFALSRNQHHCVASLVDSYVHPYRWNFGSRRNLNEVEVGELVWMLQILDRVRLSQYRGDSRRWKLDGSRCVMCNLCEESVDHLFLHCPFSLQVQWKLFREIDAGWVIPKGCNEFEALVKGKKAKTLGDL